MIHNLSHSVFSDQQCLVFFNTLFKKLQSYRFSITIANIYVRDENIEKNIYIHNIHVFMKMVHRRTCIEINS